VLLEQTNTGLFLVLRSSTSGGVVNTRIAQADWNQDTLDGNGASKISIDETRRQILDIDIEWLGVGRVRYGFNIDGKTIYAHYVNNANQGAAAPYMRSGTLPIRYEIVNDGTGAASARVGLKLAGGYRSPRAVGTLLLQWRPGRQYYQSAPN
jgi:hypothetical protein